MDSTQLTGSSQSTMYDPTLLAELTQKLGSVEKTKEVYALFAASLMPSARVIPPLPIPADSAAQPADIREERSHDSGSQHAETASQEAEKEVAVEERPRGDGLTNDETMVGTEKQENENPENVADGETPILEKVCEGETPVVDVVAEGETPILKKVAEGETLLWRMLLRGNPYGLWGRDPN